MLHQAVTANPIRDLERIESSKGHKKAPPRGLTAEERRRLLAYVDSDKTAVRADMPDLIRFALGSRLRIGEICAVRWTDLDHGHDGHQAHVGLASTSSRPEIFAPTASKCRATPVVTSTEALGLQAIQPDER